MPDVRLHAFLYDRFPPNRWQSYPPPAHLPKLRAAGPNDREDRCRNPEIKFFLYIDFFAILRIFLLENFIEECIDKNR